MAKVRIGFSTQFELENELVGIGTDNPTNTLQALGNIHAPNAKAIGVSTLTTFDGFVDTKASISGLEGSEQGSISGEIIIEGEVTVSSGTTFTSGPENLTVTDSFTLPGISEDKPSVGTTRFNENLGALEFYTGTEWRAVNSYVDSGNRSRGVCSGGWSPVPGTNSTMDVFSLTSQGNAVSFGTLAQSQSEAAGASNSIRGIIAGGGPGNDTHMEYYTMASGGTGIDFGNLTSGRRRLGGLSSSNRAIFVGGRLPGNTNIMDYVEIMTLGDAIDFGDMSDGSKTKGPSAVSSPTRGIITNGYGAGTGIDAITISSKGNAVVVGQDLFHGGYNTNGASTGTRGVWAGGYTSTASSPYTMTTTSIRGIDIASGGNATEFGNLLYKGQSTYGTGTGSHTRGFWMGGADEPNSAAAGEHIVMMNLKSGGNAENWGDLAQGRSGCTAFSDCHGGLGGF